MRISLLALRAATSALLCIPAAVSLSATASEQAAAAVAQGRAEAAAAGPAAAKGPCGRLAKPPAYKHVIWVWMENRSYGKIIGSPQAPYLNSLAHACGLATNYHNISHPSLPNYIAGTSGLGYPKLVLRDCAPRRCSVAARSIFGQGETWRAYEQSMPSNCFLTSIGKYAVRHNPPPYYKGLAGCGKNDVPYSQLPSDLANKKLAAFSFITPNLINDMHDGTVGQGDAWLAKALPRIFNSPQYRNGSTVVFVTWDEGTSGSATRCATNTTDVGCHVATLVISPSTAPGTTSAALFNHYSMLGTTEKLLGLPKLGQAAGTRTMISAFHL